MPLRGVSGGVDGRGRYEEDVCLENGGDDDDVPAED